MDEKIQTQIKHMNKIEVADFVVMSSTESLEKLEKTMDNLIKKHRDFSEIRKKKLILEHNMCG